MENHIIKLSKISKKYSKDIAIDNINMNIKKGSIYGLIGENGSGKTTILKSILGIINIDSGEIEILNDIEKDKLNNHRSKIGSLVESPAFYPNMSGYKNLEYYRILKGIVDTKIVENILVKIGLEDVKNKKYKGYSLGMKQRLGIGLALLGDAEILILDEPINGLDPKGIAEVRNLLLELNRERGITIIISSHLLGELSQIATDYGFISKGKMLEELSAKELEEKCKNYISIELNEIEKATVILETELNTLNYKVKDNNEIQLFDYIDESDMVLKTLVKNDINIKSISKKGIDLEDYYLDLIGGNKNA